MAIAVDAVSATGVDEAATTMTWAHTNNGNFICALVVQQTNDFSGVTYAGAAMTQAVVKDSNDYQTSIWYKVNPATGTNNFVATGTNLKDKVGGGISFIQGDTSNIGATNSLILPGTTADSSLTVTTTGTGNGFVIDCILVTGTKTMVPGGSQTEIFDIPSFGAGASTASASYQAYAGGANPSNSWSWTGNENGNQVGFEIIEGAAASTNPITFPLMKVG